MTVERTHQGYTVRVTEEEAVAFAEAHRDEDYADREAVATLCEVFADRLMCDVCKTIYNDDGGCECEDDDEEDDDDEC